MKSVLFVGSTRSLHVSTPSCVTSGAVLALCLIIAIANVRATGQSSAPPKPQAGLTPAIKNGVTVKGKYVSLVVGTSVVSVAPGGRVSLLVQGTPGPKIHVYAPGQQGYVPVSLAIDPDEAFRTSPLVFPPSKLFEFAPLQETVQVYDAAFVLRQDVTIAATPAVRQRATAGDLLTIKGAFNYQACDDKVCYRPEKLQVEWKVTLTPIAETKVKSK